MTGYELRRSPAGRVPAWHVTRRDDTLGLCGRLLPPDAEVRPITQLSPLPAERRCAECWAAYLATCEPDVIDT